MRKIMSSVLCVLLVLATVLAFSGCGEIVKSNYGEELVKNGNFEASDPLANWSVDEGNGIVVDTVSHSASTDEYAKLGANTLRITNTSVNSTSVKQSIQIEPGCTYLVSAVIYIPAKIEGTTSMATDYEGAYIGFAENVKFLGKSSRKTATAGNMWAYTYTFYFTTEFREVTISANVGMLGKEAKGSAYFDNISMQKVDPATLSSTVTVETLGVYVPDNGGVPGILYLSIGAVLVLLIGYFVYTAIRRHGYLNRAEDGSQHSKFANFMNKNGIIVLVIAVAVVIRAILAFIYTGHPTDMSAWGKIASAMVSNGLYIESLNAGSVTALPLVGYILWPLAQIETALGLVGSWAALLYRIPAIIADCVIIVFLYKLGKRFIGQVGGILAGILWAVIPTVLTATANWGAIDSLFAMFALLVFYFIVNINSLSNGKRFTGIFVFLVAGVLTKIEMLWFIPLVAAFLIFNFIKKKDTRKSIILGTILSIIAFYVVTLPMTHSFVFNGRPFYIWEFFYEVIRRSLSYAQDSFGLYALVGLNYKAVTSTSFYMNLAFAAILFLFTLIVYFKNKSRIEIILIAAMTIIGASTFAIDMNPTIGLTGVLLLLAYAIMVNERRVYWTAIGFGLLNFMNMALVLNFSGTLTPFIAGEVVRLTGNAWLIVMSIIQIIATLWLVYLVYDVCINDKIKQMQFLEGKKK